eukprot:SAG31_NODE_3290_length_4457_cov_5.521570_3_plen_573_part_00
MCCFGTEGNPDCFAGEFTYERCCGIEQTTTSADNDEPCADTSLTPSCYELINDYSISCSRDASDVAPQFVGQTIADLCPETCNRCCVPFTVEHATIEGEPTAGSSVGIFCDENYVVGGVGADQSTRLCLENGEWEGDVPVCEAAAPVGCVPFTVEHGDVEGEPTAGSSVGIFCDENYVVGGVGADQSTRLCLENGEWEGDVPVCEPDGCRPLTIDHGSLRVADDSTVHVVCDAGYVLHGPPAMLCQGQMWVDDVIHMPAAATCDPIDCGAYEVAGGTILGSSLYGAGGVTTTCIGTYVLQGSTVRHCMPSGEWDSPPPLCEELCEDEQADCESFISRGAPCTMTLRNLPGNPTLADVCKQSCNECGHSTNECASGPCANDAECVDGEGSYSCQCTDEFRGDNCAQVQPCLPSSNMCHHGSTCVDDGADGFCECPAGYLGQYCDLRDMCHPVHHDLEEGENSPCLNGGECTVLSSVEYECHCASGFVGDNCAVSGESSSESCSSPSEFAAKSEAISSACCDNETPCVDGLPTACTRTCGELLPSFYRLCHDMLTDIGLGSSVGAILATCGGGH